MIPLAAPGLIQIAAASNDTYSTSGVAAVGGAVFFSAGYIGIDETPGSNFVTKSDYAFYGLGSNGTSVYAVTFTYAPNGVGGIAAFDPKSGQETWSAQISNPVGGFPVDVAADPAGNVFWTQLGVQALYAGQTKATSLLTDYEASGITLSSTCVFFVGAASNETTGEIKMVAKGSRRVRRFSSRSSL